jgi:cytochrome P450
MMKPFIGSATSSVDKHNIEQQGARSMAAYFSEVIRDRRLRLGHDVITRLLGANLNGETLTDDEVIGACVLFLFGGHATTTNLIADGMRLLMKVSEAREQLRFENHLMASAVEEILRFDGPTGALVRVVKTEHLLHEKRLQSGDRVFLMVNAANRDPSRFAEPDRFKIDRNPNPRLTFIYGPHFCLGAPLARLEGRIGISEVIKRFASLGLAEGKIRFMDTLVMPGCLECRLLLPNRASTGSAARFS